ncbi:hypothetical protein BAE44_0015923 [Dichanthelium oligosanthes]|uniref:F-box domain-containing protein n=1 Tax=Dichanthelium oligosanthes TaxID=888268 RepID=A0A1E5VD33_9POAL|nr:hypothetical protein BAE44_0015923 [Dichanthelium oligosanthes]
MSTCPPEPPAPSPVTALVLPADVLLEIVARSDARTLVRCAALCKPLRRDILSPAFLRRVTSQENSAERIVPPRLLGYLHTYAKEEEVPAALFSVVHPDPATVPCARYFSDEHLAPFISRSATNLLGRYEPIKSRGGLVVLRRRNINLRKRTERRSDMCVYNPITGERTYFSDPLDISRRSPPKMASAASSCCW